MVFSVREITFKDWEAYRDYYKGLSDPHHFDYYLKGKDLDAVTTYRNLFNHVDGQGSKQVMFSLFEEKRMIGQTALTFIFRDNEKTALLAGSEIADEYRGQRLVNHLYKARMDYLAEIGFNGPVITTIKPDNLESQKAAERNGFRNTGELDEFGYYVFVPEKAAQPSAAAIFPVEISEPGGMG